MLSTLLNSLASSFSKFFIIASWLPVLAFVFFNGLMGFLLFEAFHDWATDVFFTNGTAAKTAFLTTTIVVATLAVAYVLSSLNDFLRGLLEGRWPESLRQLCTAGQARRLNLLAQRIATANRVRLDLDESSETWLNLLVDARVAGQARQTNTFSRHDGAIKQIRALQRSQIRGVLIDSRDIRAAVDALVPSLRAHNAEIRVERDQRLLGDAQEELVLLIQSATERARNELFRLGNQLTSSFGTQDVAPTAMGNIANTAQTYSVRRYDCNLELFWNNLQRVIQKDAHAYAALQESKAQLDFLVACCWLTTVSWMLWLVVMGVWGDSVLWFCILALFGPAATYFWYRSATEYYRSFADVLTTTLDLFRIDLLRALGFAAPADVADERMLWHNLHRLAAFDDEAINLRYQNFKAGP